MKIVKTKNKISCDAAGCKNLSDITIKNCYGADDVNLCKECAKSVAKELIKFVKGAENVRKNSV